MEKKLYRSRTDKMISGVSGGLAKYFGMKSNIMRVIVFLLVWFTGIGLIAYVLAALLLPVEPEATVYDDPAYTPGAETPKAPGSEGGSEGGSGYGDGSNGNSNNNNFKKY
ncbi:MAG: PspC domain-containing protein [Oscillospiraceae bacterium]|nr:PspC domain-containing protein [Oscillospiraceae bacterium]